MGDMSCITSPRCVSFFEPDTEYPDLDCRELAVKRYLRLINSTEYLTRPCVDASEDNKEPGQNLRLPDNVVTIGRRMTPYLRIKIQRALEIYPTKRLVGVHQLFIDLKHLGFRYDYKNQLWEFGQEWNKTS